MNGANIVLINLRRVISGLFSQCRLPPFKKISPTTYDKNLCKIIYHTCSNSYALIWSKNIYFCTFGVSKSAQGAQFLHMPIQGTQRHFLGFVYESKVVQNQKILEKQLKKFYLSILCANFTMFQFSLISQFSKGCSIVIFEMPIQGTQKNFWWF